MNTVDIEIALAERFNYRQNLIVPNVCWGINIHECDMLIVSKSGYLTEVEIKTSVSDLRKDMTKTHQHNQGTRIKHLYFAIPADMIFYTDYIPNNAGLFIIDEHKYGGLYARCIKSPVTNKDALQTKVREHIGHLGSMRIWKLKIENRRLIKNIQTLEKKLKGFEGISL